MAIPPVSDFRALPGAGARGRVNGQAVLVGSPELFAAALAEDDTRRRQIERLQDEGKTVVLGGTEPVGNGRRSADVLGLIAIQDTIRPQAKEAIAALYAQGVEKVVMLTGDNPRTAWAIARELGINEVYAELKPEEKAVRVRELTRRYGHVVRSGTG